MSLSIRDRLRSSLSRKKSARRPTSDLSRGPIENETDDLKRFPYLLHKYCEGRLYFLVPTIRSYLVREDGTPIQIDHPFHGGKKAEQAGEHYKQPLTIQAYTSMEMKLKNVICQSPKLIDTRLFYALQQTLTHFPTLTCLKLDYCNLEAEHIFILQKNLLMTKTLAELSLIGNPIKEQNFYHLVHCGLKVLILKFCKINEKGLRRFAKEFLNFPMMDPSTLIHLDLSSNMVFDEGCQHIASILKCDRTLQSLNLTDCKIREEGFKVLVSSFSKFSLNDEEIALRRRVRLEYFRFQQQGSIPESHLFKETRESADTNLSVLDEFHMIEDMMKGHPFIAQSSPENGEIFCLGNYSLESLNLSYNHLSKSSLDLFLKTLMEQNIAFGVDKGLQRVVLDGIGVAPYCRESEDAKNTIKDLLASKKLRSKSSSSSMKSRPSIKKRRSSAGGGSETSGLSTNAKERKEAA